jgi:CRISPR/Cas system CMR-associated protein Cmr1 (group 7 of RAMP superfamily)
MTMDRLDVTLELLSPCFLGDARQRPEFRIASLRGIWRYWFRALYGRGDEREPSEEELRIFGSTDARGAARIVPLGSVASLRPSPGPWPKPGRVPTGADYLLFTMNMNARGWLEPGQTLPLRLVIDRPDRDQAVRSLAAACAFSGLGARSRRMAGAVSLRQTDSSDTAMIPAQPAASAAALATRFTELLEPGLRRTVPAPPGYHVIAQRAFSAGVLKTTFAGWREALDAVGAEFRKFRLRKQPDYDVARGALQGKPLARNETIRRAAFGLPIRFRFKGAQESLPVRLPESDRRGSPLFLTLERLADRRLAVVWCLFRARVAPGDHIRIGTSSAPAPGLEIVDEMLSQPFWSFHRIA